MRDEDLRREQRLALSGAPLSLRRLTELERLASAIAAHGRSRPPEALLYFPRGTTLPLEAARGLNYRIDGPWLLAGGVTLEGPFLIDRADLLLRLRGLESPELGKEPEPVVEIKARPGSRLEQLFLPGAEILAAGVYFPGIPHDAPIPNTLNVSTIRAHMFVRDFEGPIVLSFELLDRKERDGSVRVEGV